MSEYPSATSDDPYGRPTSPPRQALAYVAGAVALVFAAACVILIVVFISAHRTAEEANDARTAAEAKVRQAEERDQKSLRLLGQATGARELAESKIAMADDGPAEGASRIATKLSSRPMRP